MDNTDKMEDWRMLTVGRKSAARSRMRKEKDNVRMTRAKKSRVSEMCRESRTDMGHGDIRQMARSAQLCLHYSHWSSKNSHETKVIPGGCAVCGVRRWTPPVRLPARGSSCTCIFFHFSPRAPSFGYRAAHIRPSRFTQCAYHNLCDWTHRLKLIACFSQEGKG